MNVIQTLIGGDEDVFASTGNLSTHMVTSKQKLFRQIIAVVMVGLVVGAIVYLVMTIYHNAQEVKNFNTYRDVLDNNIAKLTSQVNNTTTATNNLGMRISKLDNQVYTPVQFYIDSKVLNPFQNLIKSGFTSNTPQISGYQAELALFKSLSPSEQSEYLNLTKAAKRAKYGSTLP